MENKMRKMGRTDGQSSSAADARAFWAQNERELRQDRAANERLRAKLGATKANEIIAIYERWVIKGGRT
jgi:hypothetical protein